LQFVRQCAGKALRDILHGGQSRPPGQRCCRLLSAFASERPATPGKGLDPELKCRAWAIPIQFPS
jgi:hypothetical protein